MAEERPDDPGPSPDSRPKRAPPTIDLQATEISSEPSRTEATEEAAKEIGKDIELDIRGGDTELDKTVVEKIGDPLTHIVRNSMDHGIEAAELRLARGKPVIGIGLGAQILAIAAGGGTEPAELSFEVGTAWRVRDDALNGFLPESYPLAVYMRDRPLPPKEARILAEDEAVVARQRRSSEVHKSGHTTTGHSVEP